MNDSEEEPGTESGAASKPRRENDGSYRSLFNHAPMIRWLLRRFVAQPWIEQVDLDSLEPVKARFVGNENQQRESDLIWRAKLRHADDWFYVFILLEFQSVPDRFMALRVLEYVLMLYRDLIDQKILSHSGRLPPVLPVVLYNGSQKWRQPLQMARVIEAVGGGLEKYCPHFEFLLLDEGHLPKDELGPLDNPVTAIFELEQAKSLLEVRRLLVELGKILEGQEMEGPRRSMVTWLRRVILPVIFPGDPFPELPNLEETDPMLTERIKQWPEQWLAEGREEGLKEGREEGREEGQRDALSRAVKLQMQLRFGQLSPHQLEILDSATEERLLCYIERLVSVASAEDVLEG